MPRHSLYQLSHRASSATTQHIISNATLDDGLKVR